MKIPRSILVGGNFETKEEILTAWVNQCPDIDTALATETIASAVWATQKLVSVVMELQVNPDNEYRKQDFAELKAHIASLIDYEG